MNSRSALGFCLFYCLCTAALPAQVPEWIWSESHGAAPVAGETRFFRKTFQVGFEPQQATLTADGDDEVTIYLNGVEVGRSTHWKNPVTTNVLSVVRKGANVIAARGRNGAPGAAAVLVKLELRSPNMSGLFVVSDGTWLVSKEQPKQWLDAVCPSNGWSRAASLGKLGVQPWGEILQPPQAKPAESLSLLPGFKAELLHSAARDEGSWIAMCFDGKGRLIISPEKSEVPLLRVTLKPDGAFDKIERLNSPMRGAMGLCWAYDSLYVNGRGPGGVGLYRLIDANHNDQFDPGEETLLKNFEGDNEHGYHAVAPGPDGAIYVMNGNHTKVPAGISDDSPLTSYAEDLLLPQQWDANGHAKGILAPGGYVLRTDRDGREWRLICGGFRNTYDFDFNAEGEMFTFDSDMEWDVGAPWYRPTRILHCVSGGEYGWRSGTGKWPEYYPDSLPAVVDIGLSSPTGVRFGTRSKFPERYRRALFAADWAYGKIFAVHLEPKGATYGATFETFVSGKPLAVTAMTFGPDGALYFIIGGWKIQSGLYRISYAGETTGKSGAARIAGRQTSAQGPLTAAQRTRRALERFHGRPNPAAIPTAWPYLGDSDRSLRFAARVAVEFQPAAQWRDRALGETNPEAALGALLALARKGVPADQEQILARLEHFVAGRLSNRELLDALRLMQVCCSRLGHPPEPSAARLISVLLPLYPAASESLNRELSQLLIYLDAADVLPKTLALMSAAGTQQEQMHYAFVLRNVKHGWTAEQRSAYFAWFQKALADYKGGASFRPYLVNIRNDALANLSGPERDSIAPLLADRSSVSWQPRPRQIVKEWTFAELEPLLGQTRARSFARGRQAFIDAQCVLCHRINGDGGAVGPDLTGVSGRFGHRDLLENIVYPSKIISDRYQTFTVTLRDGDEYTGFITDETDDKLVLLVNPIAAQRQEIARREIVSRVVSKTSAMPEGLLNVLAQDEILDLLAFLEADGKSDAPSFGKRQQQASAEAGRR